MTNENTTNTAPAATIGAPQLTPRELAVDVIFDALCAAYEDGRANVAMPDYLGEATSLLEALESRVVGYTMTGEFVFIGDEDVDFIEGGCA